MNQDSIGLNASDMIDKVSPDILEPYDGNLDFPSEDEEIIDDIGIFDTAYSEDNLDSLQSETISDTNTIGIEQVDNDGSSLGFFIMFGISVLLIIAFCFYFAYKDSKSQTIDDTEEDLL